MQDQFDAVIYLGRKLSFEQWAIPKQKCSDRGYLDMRLRRLSMFDHPAWKAEIDRLKERCSV